MFDDIQISIQTGGNFAGAAGAAISMAFITGPLWYRFMLFLGGIATSHYVTPLVIDIFDIGRSGFAAAFLVGMFGMSIAAAVIRTVQAVNFDSLFEQLRAWFGRK